jgi:hypothetical protein
MTNKVKIVLLNLTAVFCTYAQVLWAAPNAVSAVDMSNSPIFYLHWYVMITLVFLNILFLIIKIRNQSATSKTILSTSLLSIFWLLMNYIEFSDRVASWSTFSSEEIWLTVLMSSFLTIGSCGIIFFLVSLKILKTTSSAVSISG